MKTPNIQVGITDHYDPEVRAMLMAMYSRSYGPIAQRLPDTKESIQNHKEKLGKFYVGYNHKSVGQLAVTDIYLEGVSQLAAKAIENHPLFNGQESSTRYIDFSTQPMISNHEEITHWQEVWRFFYLKAIRIITDKIISEYPFGSQPEGTKQSVWENTIKARVFDICRGFLPAGVTTNVGFSGTFDTINDHFGEMFYHPCQEMKNIAEDVIQGLSEKYAYACISKEKHIERNKHVTNDFFYQDKEANPRGCVYFPELDNAIIDKLKNRNKYQKLSRLLSSQYRFKLEGLIDFGSYRDLHRHRNGYINMPLLQAEYGLDNFYFSNLTEELKKDFIEISNKFHQWYIDSTIDVYDKQYCIPMGYKVPVNYECDLNQMLYLLELRSDKTVHQSLRKLIQTWYKCLHSYCGDIKIHVDMDEDNFSLKRGTQTFQTN